MESNAFLYDDVRISPELQIGMHSHSRWELSYVEYGSGTRTIGELTEKFTAEEIILIPPDIPHVWRFKPGVTDARGNIANISVFFNSGILSAMLSIFPEIKESLARLQSLQQAVSYVGETHRKIQRLLLAMRGMTPEKRLPKMIELLIAASDTAAGIYAGRNNILTHGELRLEKVRIYCACNYSRPVTLDEMSRYVGMNKSAFCTFMRHNAGMTFSDYLNNMRLERACDKLTHTDLGIAEIATDCGFQNVTYFNRLFRKKYGCTPTYFRAPTDNTLKSN